MTADPCPVPLLAAAEMQAADAHAIRDLGIPGRALMEVAGAACARSALARWPERLARAGALVVAGRGNNGGDGFVAARHLANRGVAVTVAIAGDPAAVSGDARANLDLLSGCGVRVVPVLAGAALADLSARIAAAGVVLDALLGTGLSTAPRGLVADVLGCLDQACVPVVAVDVPSGVDATTGAAPSGAPGAAVTVTFAAPKWGHFLGAGADRRGALEVVDIGIPATAVRARASGRLVGGEALARLPALPRAAHKGARGHVLVVAGSSGKPGAAVLAAVGALRAGAGLVTLAVPEGVAVRLPRRPPEVMVEEVPAADGGFGDGARDAVRALLRGKDAFVLGPGIGLSPGVAALVREAVGSFPVPGVVDADALNVLAADPSALHAAAAARVVTPHPGEAGRLLGRTAAEVNADRPGAARSLAAVGPLTVAVLKGAGTLVAEPGGPISLVALGSPAMATGGTGDVLAGVVAALLGGGLGARDAAEIGVAWHGAAGEVAGEARGERSATASDVAAALGPALQGARRGAIPPPFTWR